MNKKEQKQKIVPINVLSKKFLAGTMAAFMLTGAILPATSFASGTDDAANDTVIEESSDDKDNKDDKNEKNENKDENKNEETVDENEDKDNKDESDDSDKKDSEDKDDNNEENKDDEEVAKISSVIVGHVDGVPVYTASESKPFTVKANDAEFDIIKLVKGIEAFAGEGEIKAEFDVSKAGDKIVDVTFTDSKSKEEKHAKLFVRVLSDEVEATEADQYFVKAKKVELNEKTELDATRLVTNLKVLPEGTEVSYDKESGELTVTFKDKSEIKLKGLVEYSEKIGEGDVRTKANLVQTLSDVVTLDEDKDLEDENKDKDGEKDKDKESDKDDKKDKDKDKNEDEKDEREVNGVKVNLSELKTLIKAAKEIELKEGLYTKESAEAFTKALEKAEAVYENKESTQEEIDEAAKNLKTAQSKLVKAKDEDKKEDKKDKNEEKDNKENNKNDKKEEKVAAKTVEDKALGFTFELKDLVVKQGTVIKPSDFVANLDKMPKDYTLSFKDEKIAKTPELGEHEVVILATRDKTEEEKKENKTVNKEAQRLKDGDTKEGEAKSLPTEDKEGNKYEEITPVGVTAKENDPDKVVIELVAKVTVTKDGKALAKPIDKPEEPKAQVKTTPAEPKRINTGKQTDAEVKQSPWMIGGIGLGIAVIIGAVYNFFIKDSDKKSENTLR